MQQVGLDKENFEVFMRTISMLRDICGDVDIRGGIARQRTNDKFSVFEIDMTPVITDIDLPITEIKKKLDLFKIFVGVEDTIEITTDEEFYTISDQHTSLKFQKPDLDFMDNKFMPENERDALFIRNEEDIILTTELSSTISDRMRIITQGFNVNMVHIMLEGETASITARTQSKDQFAKLKDGIIVDRVMEASSNISNIPFIIDHDGDMEFKMYLASEDDGVVANQFSTSISDVEINIYGRSSLIEVEDTEEE